MDQFHPANWFSPVPGTSGTIHSRTAIRDWYARFAADSQRMRVEQIGISTEGNPIDALYVANDMSDTTFARLKSSRCRTVDDLVAGDGPNRDQHHDLPIILITSGIHATEIGGPQSIPELAHWLVASDSAEAAMIRDRCLTIIVPTLNPDGMDLVHRWHHATLGTDREGTLPPLLYHRFAGHDNNRDWLFRNLPESRVLLDAIHRPWLPHVTLDQHQMAKFGPRFVLPPFCDPWNPWVPKEIIAASTMLGQTIAADMTIQGFQGVQTNKYFDAWEPSRAIQHFRGGIRILTEAASANLAQPIQISDDQLRKCPMPQSQLPSQGQPSPWPGGTWKLENIVDYHLVAAKSLLQTVACDPERYISVQRQALTTNRDPRKSVHYSCAISAHAGDAGAQDRLARMLVSAGVAANDEHGDIDGDRPLSSLAHAVLQPTVFPAEHGPTSYDLTSHHLPIMMGATIRATTQHRADATIQTPTDSNGHGAFLSIDARSHQAPKVLESAIRAGRPIWRTRRAQFADGEVVQPGSWLLECSDSELAHTGAVVTSRRLASVPDVALPVTRRDILLVSLSDEPAADYGWTRLWLHDQHIPFLETRLHHLARIGPLPANTILAIPESPPTEPTDTALAMLEDWLSDGGNVLSFGKTSRVIARALAPGIRVIDGDSQQEIKAPGALLSLKPNRSHFAGWGLDRSIPAVYSRDGAFDISASPDTTVVATFAHRDSIVSGWMAGVEHIAGQAAMIESRRGEGNLWACSFRPIFRAQSLVTTPLVHNLLYQVREQEGQP